MYVVFTNYNDDFDVQFFETEEEARIELERRANNKFQNSVDTYLCKVVSVEKGKPST